jgi:hypothetical protein
MDWRPVTALVLGILALFQAVRVQRGKSRSLSYLRQFSSSALIRNLPLTLVPTGLALISVFAATVSVSVGLSNVVTALLVLGLPIGLLAALWFAIKPPDFVKPQWLIDEDDGSRPARLTIGDALLAVTVTIVGVVGITSLVFLWLSS